MLLKKHKSIWSMSADGGVKIIHTNIFNHVFRTNQNTTIAATLGLIV